MNQDANDQSLLEVLRSARRQNDSFGVGLDPGDPRLPALERLREAGDVTDTTWPDGTTWYQAVLPKEP